MDGILVVDKPLGPTSHDICDHFKRTLPVKKVGHAGTLDPLATGVLIILLDRATQMQSLFMGREKTYRFTMRLGESTDTYDLEGKVLKKKTIPENGEFKLKSLLKDFRGEIDQIPPLFSAIKKDGVPLYKRARRNEVVALSPRKVRIESIEIIRTDLPEVEMEVRCSSGTYIRSLAHDIGEKMGCGAVVTALRRLRSEPFGLEDAISLK